MSGTALKIPPTETIDASSLEVNESDGPQTPPSFHRILDISIEVTEPSASADGSVAIFKKPENEEQLPAFLTYS